MWVRDELERRPDLINELARTLSKERINSLRAHALVIAGFVRDSNRVMVTTCDSYESSARYTAMVFSSIAGKEVTYVDPEDLMYYIAPYDEGRESKVLIYSSEEGLQTLSMLIDQLTWTGHEILLIAQKQLSEELKYRLGDSKPVSLDSSEWLIDTHIVASLAASELAEGRSVRKSRIMSELNSIDAIMIKDLLQSYSNVLKELKIFIQRPFITTASPSMWGVAEELVYNHFDNTYLVRPEAVYKHVSRVNRVLMISTDVEEYSLKQVRALSITRNAEVFPLYVRTDPITSPIYGLLLIKFL
ncbi:MAG: hypothetical protein QW116_08065 [Zestosphaera sp.]